LIDLVYITSFNVREEWDYAQKSMPRYMMIFMDPNCGGENEMAMIAGVHYQGQRLVCKKKIKE
jgi:hypothetical protein